MSDSLNVSVEPHLKDALEPISDVPALVPLDISATTIPYSTLQRVSNWARSTDGQSALRARSLEPNAYSMISLLAGAKTSPERKFGDYAPPREPEQVEAERRRERKAITTLINALLSILGAGAAAYYASERASWRNEWRVLFALFVAVVVAVSEGVLYLIWQSRRSKAGRSRKRLALHKKHEDEPSTEVDAKEEEKAGLRRRTTKDSS